MTRIRPENRRPADTVSFTVGEGRRAQSFTVAIGRLEDGSPIEVFVNGHKAATDLDCLARDAGIVISFALQHGATVGMLRDAVSREQSGAPTSLLGRILDMISDRP